MKSISLFTFCILFSLFQAIHTFGKSKPNIIYVTPVSYTHLTLPTIA